MPRTNRGKWLANEYLSGRTAVPANYYIALVTDAVTPTLLTKTLGELTEIVAGNGYATGGFQLTPGATDFDSHVENDVDNRDELQIKDVSWPAVSGPIPASGDPAWHAVLTTNEATIADRQVIEWWPFIAGESRLDGQTLTLIDLETRGREVA